MKTWAAIIASFTGFFACWYYFQQIEYNRELYFEKGYSSCLEECHEKVKTTGELYYKNGRSDEKAICEKEKLRLYSEGFEEGKAVAKLQCEEEMARLTALFEEKNAIQVVEWEQMLADTLLALRDSFSMASERANAVKVKNSEMAMNPVNLSLPADFLNQIVIVFFCICLITVSAAALQGLFRKRWRFR